jgi:predicted ATP-grasp superfamily ATP-dependent carboligase
MKIRQGFVSNSSSSSFCIYGVEIDHKELYELAIRLGFEVEKEEPEVKTKEQKHLEQFLRGKDNKLAEERDGVELYEYESYDPYDLIDYINEQVIKVKCFTAYCGENYYIGREFKSIEDKETGKSFKKSIENELDELDVLELPKTIEEAWHD